MLLKLRFQNCIINNTDGFCGSQTPPSMKKGPACTQQRSDQMLPIFISVSWWVTQKISAVTAEWEWSSLERSETEAPRGPHRPQNLLESKAGEVWTTSEVIQKTRKRREAHSGNPGGPRAAKLGREETPTALHGGVGITTVSNEANFLKWNYLNPEWSSGAIFLDHKGPSRSKSYFCAHSLLPGQLVFIG